MGWNHQQVIQIPETTRKATEKVHQQFNPLVLVCVSPNLSRVQKPPTNLHPNKSYQKQWLQSRVMEDPRSSVRNFCTSVRERIIQDTKVGWRRPWNRWLQTYGRKKTFPGEETHQRFMSFVWGDWRFCPSKFPLYLYTLFWAQVWSIEMYYYRDSLLMFWRVSRQDRRTSQLDA